MGWTVIREDFHGNALSEKIEFSTPTPSLFEDPRFTLLKYIDPYDDTTFNGLMCRDLVKDLAELKNTQHQDHQQLDKLIELARACTTDPHTYLKFYGD